MKNIFIIVTLLFTFASCTDLENEYFDRIPETNFPENKYQSAAVMASIYDPMRDFLDWGGWWFAQEVTSDEVVCPTRHTDWDDGGKWRVLHQHTWTNSTEAIEGMWPRFYTGIGEANKWIDATATATGADAEKARAELKVMRAFYYYLLIDNYGDVPYVDSYVSADPTPSKTDRATIFNNIVADIENSVVYLDETNVKTKVTKGMAYSLLAKLYLNAEVYTGTEQWAKAEEACDAVIDLGLYSLENDLMAPFFEDNGNSVENIFTIPYDENDYTGFNLHMRTLHYISNKTFGMIAGPWNGFATVETHYNLYEENDLRQQYFMVGKQFDMSGQPLFDETAGENLVFDPHIPALQIDATYTPKEIRMSGARVKKFEIANGAKENMSNDFPVFRYADILLMKAEAAIRQGKSGDTWVNMIRSRAAVVSFSDATLDDILDERGREMFWEGHRRQDLIRFNEFNKAWWEKSASDAGRNVFPIPQSVLDSNPKLQ